MKALRPLTRIIQEPTIGKTDIGVQGGEPMILLDDTAPGSGRVSFTGADGKTLWIFTGIAMFTFRGDPQRPNEWIIDQVVGDIILNFDVFAIQDFEIVASASLASIFNSGVATNAGWAINWIVADRVRRDDGVSVIRYTAEIAVSDQDGWLRRMAYQIFATGIL